VTSPPISDTLIPGTILLPGQTFISGDGRSYTLQVDGNLVLRNATGFIIWSSNTTGLNVGRFEVAADGSYVLYDTNGMIIWTHGCSNILGSGQSLSVGEFRTSCSGNAQIKLILRF
jgi:hypothetical protein